MPYCGPSCAVPPPLIGLGSPYRLGCGYGLGYAGLGYRRPYYPSGVAARSLGIVPGVNPSCINQLPPSEVVICPPPYVVTVPGPVLSSTGEPVAVGGHTACAVGNYGYGYRYGLSRYGRRRYGRRFYGPSFAGCGYIPLRRRYCGYPC